VAKEFEKAQAALQAYAGIKEGASLGGER